MNEKTGVYLGIDVGSVSTNVVLIDAVDHFNVREALYIRTNGQPLEAVMQGLSRLNALGHDDTEIIGVGVTGSARALIGEVVGADIVKNEITAHALAAINQVPDVKTVLEIGGQDSKIIIIRDGVVVDFAMNSVCAAGTGSFLDQQAYRLKIPIEKFGDYALRAKNSARIAGRCTVFAESDMIHKQQLGFSKEALISGLCDALVRNYLNNIAKGKDLEEPILFQGGVAFNEGMRAAFEKEFNSPIIIPKNFHVMGAIGSALLVGEHLKNSAATTKFRGLSIVDKDIKITMEDCNGCSNQCELTKMSIAGTDTVSIWGDRCGKWQTTN